MSWSLFFLILFVLLGNVLVQRRIPPGLVENENAETFEVYSLKETFINDCPYRNPKFELSTGALYGKNLWLAKKNAYGYFEDRNYNYKIINDIHPETNEDGITDCIYYFKDSELGTSYFFSSCDRKGVYELCVYYPENEDFCLSYEAICKSMCYGKSEYKSQFSCGAIYDENASCENCDEAFEKYPVPVIIYDEKSSFSEIGILIRDRHKVLKKNDGLAVVHCIHGTMKTDSDSIFYVLEESELTNRELIEDDQEIIWIMNDVHRFYECIVFTYPNVTATGNRIILPNVYSYLSNVTVPIDPKGVPFTPAPTAVNLITTSLQPVLDRVTVELYLLHPQNQDTGTITFSFHIHAADWDGNAEDMYNTLLELLDQHHTLKSCTHCFEEQITTNEETLIWPTSKLGDIVPTTELFVTEDGLPLFRSCNGTFMPGASWSPLKMPILGSSRPFTKKLYDILNNPDLTANEINHLLLETVRNATDVIPYDVYLIGKCLQKVIDSGEFYEGRIAINTIELVMDFDRSILHSSQVNLMATDTLLTCYDSILENLKDCEHPTLIEGEKIIGQVVHIDSTTNGIAVYQKSNGIHVVQLSVSKEEDIEKTDLVVASYFPPEMKHQTTSDSFLVSAIFLNSNLFNDEHKSDWEVMSTFVTNLKNPFIIGTIPVIFGERSKNIDSAPTCGYWKYGLTGNLTTIFGRWEDDGEMTKGTNYLVCHFDHMTHFALIFGAPEDKVVNILTAIMTSISIISILFIYLTAICFEKWRREEGVKILLNYSAAILLQDVLILTFDLVDVKNVFCTIYGVLLHFSIIAQFTWMLFINYVQYRKFVQVFKSRLNNNPAKFILLTWLLPLIPIILVLAVDVNSYQNDDYCFIQDLNLYLSLFLPISLTVIVNIILFVKIALSIFKNNTNAIGTSLLKYKINVCVLLFFLSGFTWTFGLLANAFQSLILSYLFCTMAVGQGLLLWIYFVLAKKDVRRFWLDKLRTKLLTMQPIRIPRPTLSTSQKSTESYTSNHI